ncbi:unnamed protein product [Haemonchus placei]|uniref:Cwf21 domain-containing protein n=1 Tax=Haemonchus placei TaxID=6290 RepID=A0A0N4X3Y9_HAEPC|nr:unnamed protein product [Haemonchus placei]
MYNGIGLQTARGTGTNGYVQANLSNLLLSKRVEYNSEADIRRAEAEINRGPNEEILQHQRKRVIEMKCAEFEMLMEEKGFDDDEIQKKVSDYRKLLLGQLESGELNLDAELGTRDSHARAKAAVKNRDKMRSALGLSEDFVPGKSMENMKKTDVVGAALTAPAVSSGDSLLSTLKKEMKEKSEKDKVGFLEYVLNAHSDIRRGSSERSREVVNTHLTLQIGFPNSPEEYHWGRSLSIRVSLEVDRHSQLIDLFTSLFVELRVASDLGAALCRRYRCALP